MSLATPVNLETSHEQVSTDDEIIQASADDLTIIPDEGTAAVAVERDLDAPLLLSLIHI